MNTFIVKFNQWLQENRNLYTFDPVLVNKKFKELNSPYNPKQEKDFVDYNH